MSVLNFFNTKQGRIIISIIWGLGLACLFRKVCVGRNCIVYTAPNPNSIVNNIYKHNSKCFKYGIETVKCTNDTINNLTR